MTDEAPRPCDVAAAAAEAARGAVAAAFAELQAALLSAVSVQLAERLWDGGPRTMERLPDIGPKSMDRLPDGWPRSMERLPDVSQRSAKLCREADQPHRGTTRQTFAACRVESGSERDLADAPVTKAMSVVSGKSLRFAFPACSEVSGYSDAPVEVASSNIASSSSLESLVVSRISHTPPTVQSLQADLALAVLQQGGLVRATSKSSMWGCSVNTSSGNLGRVVPDFDDPILASEVASSNVSSDAARARARDQQAARADPPFLEDSEAAEPCSFAALMQSTSSRVETGRMSSSELLKARCNELAMEAAAFSSVHPSEGGDRLAEGVPGSPRRRWPSSVPTVMLVFGLLPWDRDGRPRLSLTFQWACRAVLALCTATFFLLSFGYIGNGGCRGDRDGCWQRSGFFSQLPLPIGAVVVSALASTQQRAFEETLALLLSVSFERSYQAWHSRQTLWDKLIFTAIWLCASISACVWSSLSSSSADVSGGGALHAVVVSALSGFILCLGYGMVHVCRSLTIMIDAFCCDVVNQESAKMVAHTWNMTQAILRKASVSVEHCLLGLCFVLVFAVPLLLVDVLHTDAAPILPMVPTICVTCGILYMLLLASTITEQCARVPALVNALSFGEGTEAARQQTVDYISSSAAGFYVFGARLTMASVLKFMYVWCIVVLGLLTRISTS